MMHERNRVFLLSLYQHLEESGERAAGMLLLDMIDRSAADTEIAEDLRVWVSGEKSTTGLFKLADHFGNRADLGFFNAVSAIDSASLHTRNALPLTTRSIDGRLFQAQEWDNGWRLSLQADSAGYQCLPRARLAHLEDYELVEAVIYHPHIPVVDPVMLNLPEWVTAKFTVVDLIGAPAIGQNLTWSDVAHIRETLSLAAMHPNLGVPRGDIGWAGRDLWHGTDRAAADDIVDFGININLSAKGYFGAAFYAADTAELAVSHYAEASEDGAGALISFCLSEKAHVLDLRNPQDAAEWEPYAKQCGSAGFDRLMRRRGIDAVYDRSMGGLAIYNPNVIEALRLVEPKPEPIDLSHSPAF